MTEKDATALQNLPLGIQNFESLRWDNYLYVDKTAIMYRLVTTGRYYFLSRPRRFGKSLFLSTLHAYFDGKKELFEGLAVSKLEKAWNKHPVLHLDLNTEKYDTPEALDGKLNAQLVQWEYLYGKEETEVSLPLRFEGIIRRACQQTGQRVVILVDEYDKPMLQAIDNPELQTAYRNTLKAFYGALKSCDQYIKLGFLTGVTKSGKVSVFSDLNNLTDLSMAWDYHDICGISEEEFLQYFPAYIQRLADRNRLTYEATCEQLRQRYDGYHFCEDVPGMYNPYSLLNTFARQRFGSYWFETGTPSYLVYLLQQHDYNLEQMSHERVTAKVLDSIDSMSSNPIPVIYQSGYLTIKSYDGEFGTYQLGFPNKEVEEGFINYLMPFYTPFGEINSPFQIEQFVREVRSGETEAFLKRLRSFFADTDYALTKNTENHYQNVLFILAKLCGFYVKAEYHTSQGRIDMVLQTKDYTYIMEFKLDGTAEEAMRQVKSKEYALPFETSGTQVIRIGMNFSKETRNIEKWIVE